MIQPEKIAALTSYGITLVIKITYPLSFILTASIQIFDESFQIKDNFIILDEIKFILSQAVVVNIHKTKA